MKNLKLICLAIFTSFIVLTSSASISLAKEIEDSEKIVTITLYRHGIDGSINPIDINIDLSDGNFEDLIQEKCNELLKDDETIQEYLENFTFNLTGDTGILLVKSRGKGFHFEHKVRIKLFNRPKILERILDKFTIFKFRLPNLNIITKKPYLFCKYSNDEKANTTITPLLRSLQNENASKTIEGNHSVLVYNFIGYTSWFGRFSFSPFDILPRTFVGYGRVAVCNRLT